MIVTYTTEDFEKVLSVYGYEKGQSVSSCFLHLTYFSREEYSVILARHHEVHHYWYTSLRLVQRQKVLSQGTSPKQLDDHLKGHHLISKLREQAEKRPSDYEKLSAKEQWEIDKELGILDWDGR
jgi:phosphoribosylaminoimidazole carboxylase (NCAIR synthetase)